MRSINVNLAEVPKADNFVVDVVVVVVVALLVVADHTLFSCNH